MGSQARSAPARARSVGDFAHNHAGSPNLTLVPPPYKHTGDVAHEILRDLGLHAFRDASLAPDEIKQQFKDAVSLEVADAAQVTFARVRFGTGGRFDLNEQGRPAFLAPVLDGGDVIDVAAFDFNDRERRGLYRRGSIGVGLESALHAARYHPHERLHVHYDVRSWLRAGCVGALPVDWRHFAIWLLEHRVTKVVGGDAEQDRLIQARLRREMKLPALFIRGVSS